MANPGSRLRLLVLIYGSLTLVAQILLFREFLVSARGREIHLSAAFWAWLGWTGLGSLFGGLAAGRVQWSPKNLGQIIIGLAALLPLTILATRLGSGILAGRSAELAAAGWWLSYLILCGPFCFLSGLFFPLAGKIRTDSLPEETGVLGRIYGWEALGMAAGGLLATAWILASLPSLSLAVLVSSLSALLALGIGCGQRVLGWLLFVGILLLAGGSGWLDQQSRRWQLPGRQLLVAVETPYNLWQITAEEGQLSFSANGLWSGTYPDPQTAEEQVHLALLQHPRPERVLLLGGGALGLAEEILRHPTVKEVVYIEPDPGLLSLARRVLPPAAAGVLADPRLLLVPEDGRRFLRQDQRRYEVILNTLPDPETVQLNRYYTREFLQLARKRLQPDGVFSCALSASETSLSPWRRQYLQVMAATFREVFPVVVVLSGPRWRFLATCQGDYLTPDPVLLETRLRERGLALQYVRDYYLRARLAPTRQARVQHWLAAAPPERNTDFSPTGFYYALVLASLEEQSWWAGLLLALKNIGFPGFFLAVVVLSGSCWLWGWSRWNYPPNLTPAVSVVVLGFSSLSAELVLLLVFQLVCGHLYGHLGLLLVAFMLGLALGALTGSRWVGHLATAGRLCRWSHGWLAGWLLILGWQLPGLADWPLLAREFWATLAMILLLGLTGGLSGLIFAGVSAAVQTQGHSLARQAGWLYALDLAGATLGSLGGGLLLIPCFGLVPVLWVGGWLNLLAVGLWWLTDTSW